MTSATWDRALLIDLKTGGVNNMKITQKQLSELIKEEIQKITAEAFMDKGSRMPRHSGDAEATVSAEWMKDELGLVWARIKELEERIERLR